MELSLPDDFKEFLKLLNCYQIEYLLIGGFAVGYHGYPRATNDMDIWVASTEENAANLVAAISEFGFDQSELTPKIFLQPKKIVRMGVPPMRIEVLTSISGVEFSLCYSERIEDSIDGVTVNVISLEHLKANKLASGRLKDLNDLEHLP